MQEHEMTIHIFEASEGGYMYDIYAGTPEEIESGLQSEDGGLCTTTMQNALEMAASQALDLIKSKRPAARQFIV